MTPIKPALNFGFRFQAGYTVRVPLNQYFGSGHAWVAAVKIIPEEGGQSPVYLVTPFELPEIPKTNVFAEFGGGYLLGEGRYRVEWTLVDETNRVCRKDWTIDAGLKRSERKVKIAMPPNTVADLSLRGAPHTGLHMGIHMDIHRDDAHPIRITVLLHATPLFPRRTKLRPSDVLLLLGSLSSLLERLPASSVRLVVFNLDQQNELFRQDDFAMEALGRVAQSMDKLELGMVDYSVLQNRHSVEFLADLVNQELASREPPDVVLFLGPTSRHSEQVRQSALKRRGPSPRFFYFQFAPYFRRNANVSDSIGLVVAKLKGKAVLIHSPGEFAKAIEQLEMRMAAGKAN